jgi:hypothetical protein
MERAALRPRGEAEHAKVHAATDSAETSEHASQRQAWKSLKPAAFSRRSTCLNRILAR